MSNPTPTGGVAGKKVTTSLHVDGELVGDDYSTTGPLEFFREDPAVALVASALSQYMLRGQLYGDELLINADPVAKLAVDALRKAGWVAPGEVPPWMQQQGWNE